MAESARRELRCFHLHTRTFIGIRNAGGPTTPSIKRVNQGSVNRLARFLVSFDDGSMDHIPAESWPAVGEASHGVVREAKAAGIWIFGGGVERQQAMIVAADGVVTPGPSPETKAVIGGFVVIEVASRDEAIMWARKFAAACDCAQEVREIMFDPES
jgi:hypothetical protein